MQDPTLLSSFSYLVWRLSQIGQLKKKTWLGSVEPIRLEMHLCFWNHSSSILFIACSLVQPSLCGCLAFWCFFESGVTLWNWMRILRPAGFSLYKHFYLVLCDCNWSFFKMMFPEYHRFVSSCAKSQDENFPVVPALNIHEDNQSWPV